MKLQTMPAEEILATANKKLDEAKELVKKKRERYRVQNYDYDARDWSTISAHKDEDYAIINAEILARRYRTIDKGKRRGCFASA